MSWIYLICFPFGIFSNESASTSLQLSQTKPKPQVGKVKGNKGKVKANNVNLIPAAPYNFIEEQEETISQYSSNIKPHGRNA